MPALSTRRWRSWWRASAARSEPARSMRDILPNTRPRPSFTRISHTACERLLASFMCVFLVVRLALPSSMMASSSSSEAQGTWRRPTACTLPRPSSRMTTLDRPCSTSKHLPP